jgi:eukaryotic-like serine/threonine-protein kinase
MVQRIDDPRLPDEGAPWDSSDDDERVGEAIEAYLALAEQGQPPPIEEFAARYPDLRDDVHAALEGLELVHGLLGLGSAAGSGSRHGSGVDRRIESGQRIAGYKVVGELGRGGMGTVYEAVHMALDRPVALKVLGVHAAPDSSARRRFLNEARTAAGLHHTHIVPVWDVGQVGGLCYYAMQRIEGSGLDRVVRHLRRTRQFGSGGGTSGSGTHPSGGSSRLPEVPSASGTSSVNARLSRLWSRVSARWPWRQPGSLGWDRGGDGPGPTRSVPSSPRADAVNRLLSYTGLGDSTASWDTSGRRGSDPDRRDRGDSDAGVPASLATLAAASRAPRRREDDQPPPFGTPRGFAYFRWVATVGFQAADALAHAHHQGVIHRDVKPSNLLVDAKGSIWVTDFGLARRLADPGLTHHDSLLGTPRYMSPEQARTGSIDGRTDVYSLGATLYELLTLRPPFDGQTAAELLDQIGQDEPVPPRAFDPRIPLDLETIVLKALAKRPVDRYPTAAELAEDLTRFLNREPVKARRISPIGRLWRVARRHPGITSVTTAAAVAVLAIATYAYVRVDDARKIAIHHLGVAEEALKKLSIANQQSLADMKESYVKTVELVEKSDVPDRRTEGLDWIRKTVALEPDVGQRFKLRDFAVKFLMLRQVEPQNSGLATGRAHGLAFGPNGNRLAVLSEDNEELALWDVVRRQRRSTLSLRADANARSGSLASGPASEPNSTEPGGDRAEPGQGDGALGTSGLNSGRNGPGAASSRTRTPSFGRRLTPAGQYVAALLPDGKGVRLIDVASGTSLRAIHRPDRLLVLGVLADPAGQRLITIEGVLPEETAATEPAGDFTEFQVNLWDPDQLDKPPIRLRLDSPPARSAWPPLVAISPDGKTVAVAPSRGGRVWLFAGEDGKNLNLRSGRPLETQTELSALALGPNGLLATAGGGMVRLWDLDSRAFLTELPPTQSFTWQMRFSPQGTLLALAGLGPVELWDPVAHTLVAVLKNPEQVNDLAFAPDGQTLAVVDRSGETSLWKVTNSAMRTQLSGLDSRPSSLAFSDDGILVGGGLYGKIWFWREGRCPEVSSPLPLATPNDADPGSPIVRSGPAPTPTLSTTHSSTDPPRTSGPPGGRPHAPLDRRGGFREMDPRPTSLAFDAQGRLVAHDLRSLRIWQAGSLSAQTPPSLQVPLPPIARKVWPNPTQTARTADGRIMALIRSSGVFLWHVEAPNKIVPVVPPPHSGIEPAPASIPGAQRTNTLGADNSAPLFRSVQIAPRGDRLYLIDMIGLLHVWALDGPSAVEASAIQARDLDWAIPVAEGGFNNLALTGDGAILALGDRSPTVTLVNTSNHRILNRIKHPNGEAESYWFALALSPDGRDLAVGSEQGTISLWSIAQTTRPRLRFRLPGHRGITTSLVFDAQGRRLASAGMEPLVEVWDLELIQRELAQLKLDD